MKRAARRVGARGGRGKEAPNTRRTSENGDSVNVRETPFVAAICHSILTIGELTERVVLAGLRPGAGHNPREESYLTPIADE